MCRNADISVYCVLQLLCEAHMINTVSFQTPDQLVTKMQVFLYVVYWCLGADVSENYSAFIYRAKSPRKSQKTRIFVSTSVRASYLGTDY